MAEIKKEQDAKTKALEATLSQIEKVYGKGSVMKMSDKPAVEVDIIPTGSLKINEALGTGGYPKGRIVEIYGPEASGKTTLALHAVAECQKQGGTVAYIDYECALDPVYAQSIGVDLDKIIISQPSSGEEGLDIAERLINSSAIDLVVVDSVAAIVPKAELSGDIGDSHIGLQARLMSQTLRKITSSVSKSNTCMIFINQLREKVGIMFGNPEVTTGGRALAYYASVRIDIRRIETVKESNEAIANRVRVKISKNKLAAPFKQVETKIVFGKGLDVSSEIVDIAIEKDIIKKSGSWFTLPDGQRFQGASNVQNYLDANQKDRDLIVASINGSEEKTED